MAQVLETPEVAPRSTGPGEGPPSWLPAASLGTVYIVWGSTYLGIRVAVETIPPMLMAGARFLLAGAVVYAVAIRRGDRLLDRPRRVHWRSAALIGALLLVGGNGMVGEAETRVPSGIAALLVATVPLWIVGLDRVILGRRLRARALAGMVVALAGAVLLVRPSGGHSVDLAGAAVLLVATLSWAAGTLVSRDSALPRRAFVASGMEMMAGGALALVAGAVLGEWGQFHPSAVSTRSLVALVYLVVAGSLLAYTAYQYSLQTLPTSTVATYAYVNPIIAVALGVLVLGEHVDWQTGVAAAIMVAGVALVIRSPARHPTGDPAR